VLPVKQGNIPAKIKTNELLHVKDEIYRFGKVERFSLAAVDSI
jgi:hypothetical protein